MVLSEQKEAIGAKVVDLAWTSRENTEADSLSNMVFDGFDRKHRVHIDMTAIQCKVLFGLLVHGQTFHEELLRHKAERVDERLVKRNRRREERLRVVEPW